MDLSRKSRQEVKWISDYFFQTLLVIDTQGRVDTFRIVIGFNLFKDFKLDLFNGCKMCIVDKLSF